MKKRSSHENDRVPLPRNVLVEIVLKSGVAMLIKMLATSGSCKHSWARGCNFIMLRRSTSLSFPETSMDESILLVLNVRRLHTIREKVTFAGCPCVKPAVALFALWLAAKLWKHCSRQELPSSFIPSLRSCLNQRLNRELQRYKDIPRKMSDQHLTGTSHSRLTMYYCEQYRRSIVILNTRWFCLKKRLSVQICECARTVL